jgi:hypothetical protein
MKEDMLQETEEQFRRHGRVVRKEDCTIARKFAERNPQVKWGRVRPGSTWTECMQRGHLDYEIASTGSSRGVENTS